MKKDAFSSKGNRKDFGHIFNIFLSQQFLWIRSWGNVLRRYIWTSSFRCFGAYTQTFLPGIGSCFFSASSFFAHSCKRNDREDTHVHYVFSLFVFVVVFVVRTVSRQSHSVFTRLVWRKPRWSDSRSSSNFECLRADIDRYDTLDIRQISWNTARVTLICITYNSSCTLRFALTMVVVFHPRRASKLLHKRITFSNYKFESRLTQICLRDVRFYRRHEDVGTQKTIRSTTQKRSETRLRNATAK